MTTSVTTAQRSRPLPPNADATELLYSKVSWRIIPLLLISYMVAYLDRVNVGFASLTMNKALGFSSAVYGFGGGIFFLGYFIFEVPSNILLSKVGARVWIARILITWGIISGCTALISGPISLSIDSLPARPRRGRLLPRHHPLFDLVVSVYYRSRIVGVFMVAIPLSNILGSIVVPASCSILTAGSAWPAGNGYSWCRACLPSCSAL